MSSFASVADLQTLLRRTFSSAESDAASLILADVSALIRSVAGMALDTVVADSITIDGHGCSSELLPEWPVQAVHSVSVTRYDGAGTPTVVALAEHVDYEWSTAGVLTATSWTASANSSCGGLTWGSRPVSTVPVWPARPRSITVNYDHGPDAEMLAVLQAICLSAAARTFYNPESQVLTTDGSGGFGAGHIGAGALSDAETATIRSFRTIRAA